MKLQGALHVPVSPCPHPQPQEQETINSIIADTRKWGPETSSDWLKVTQPIPSGAWIRTGGFWTPKPSLYHPASSLLWASSSHALESQDSQDSGPLPRPNGAWDRTLPHSSRVVSERQSPELLQPPTTLHLQHPQRCGHFQAIPEFPRAQAPFFPRAQLGTRGGERN